MQKSLRATRVAVLSLAVVACAIAVLLNSWSQEAIAFQDDRKSEAEIRKALAQWVEATNRRDSNSAQSIWGPNVVGWFPRAQEFSGSAAFALAGIPEKKGVAYSTYELTIDEVDVSGSLAAVHDIWVETVHFDGSGVMVKRVIRGSELWRLQGDGKWKIVRWVSAPEKWEKVQ